MIPRKPPEAPEDDVQNEILRAIHDALDAPADIQPLAAMGQDMPPGTGETASVDTEVEVDRTEAYLKGPTVFTA